MIAFVVLAWPPGLWTRMETGDRIAVASVVSAAVIGLLSLAANVWVLGTNRAMAKANKDMARAANKSLVLAEQANALTTRAMEDQIEVNRFARAASVVILEHRHEGPTARAVSTHGFRGTESLDQSSPSFVTLTLANVGATSAYHVHVAASDFADPDWSTTKNFDPRDASQPFASRPWANFLTLHPQEEAQVEFAIRNTDEHGRPNPTLEFCVAVMYRDALGDHKDEVTIFVPDTEEHGRWPAALPPSTPPNEPHPSSKD